MNICLVGLSPTSLHHCTILNLEFILTCAIELRICDFAVPFFDLVAFRGSQCSSSSATERCGNISVATVVVGECWLIVGNGSSHSDMFNSSYESPDPFCRMTIIFWASGDAFRRNVSRQSLWAPCQPISLKLLTLAVARRPVAFVGHTTSHRKNNGDCERYCW